MPMIDGIEACRIMSNYKKNVPYHFLTALTDPCRIKKVLKQVLGLYNKTLD